MKMYLVFNEAKNECYGTDDYDDAYYAMHGHFPEEKFKTGVSTAADSWFESYGEDECSIVEVEI